MIQPQTDKFSKRRCAKKEHGDIGKKENVVLPDHNGPIDIVAARRAHHKMPLDPEKQQAHLDETYRMVANQMTDSHKAVGAVYTHGRYMPSLNDVTPHARPTLAEQLF